jgi:hypothetical protein
MCTWEVFMTTATATLDVFSRCYVLYTQKTISRSFEAPQYSVLHINLQWLWEKWDQVKRLDVEGVQYRANKQRCYATYYRPTPAVQAAADEYLTPPPGPGAAFFTGGDLSLSEKAQAVKYGRSMVFREGKLLLPKDGIPKSYEGTVEVRRRTVICHDYVRGQDIRLETPMVHKQTLKKFFELVSLVS